MIEEVKRNIEGVIKEEGSRLGDSQSYDSDSVRSILGRVGSYTAGQLDKLKENKKIQGGLQIWLTIGQDGIERLFPAEPDPDGQGGWTLETNLGPWGGIEIQTGSIEILTGGTGLAIGDKPLRVL